MQIATEIESRLRMRMRMVVKSALGTGMKCESETGSVLSNETESGVQWALHLQTGLLNVRGCG